jgi:hypothetical protein
LKFYQNSLRNFLNQIKKQPLINYRRILNDEPGGGHGQKARLSTATRGRKRAAPQDGKKDSIFFKFFLFIFLF